jgi:protein ImuB
VRPPPAFAAARELPEPIATRPAIERVLALLLDELCATLARAGQDARRLVLRAFRVDRAVQELAIGTGAASHSPAHFAQLFAPRLDRLEPDLGFEQMALEATCTELLSGRQAALSADPEVAVGGSEALADLPEGWAGEIRPVRLLAAPEPLLVTSEGSDGPPRQLRQGRAAAPGGGRPRVRAAGAGMVGRGRTSAGAR